MKSERVIAYIDGFNLYFGIKELNKRYYWLDINAVCKRLLRGNQHLVCVKYFTSRIKGPDDKRKRQSTFIDALKTIPDIQVFYGKYQFKPNKCKKCDYVNQIPEEKMTDVQLAVEMVSDAHQNNYDTALLITGDIDLVPSIERIQKDFKNKRIIVVFPPKRSADELRNTANAYLHITESILKKCLLPDDIPTVGGYTLKRPEKWIS